MGADPVAALQSAQDTLEWSLRHRGPDSPMTLEAKSEVAQKLERLGRLNDALVLRDEVVTQWRSTLGTDDPHTLAAEAAQGFVLDRLGRHAEALPLFAHIVEARTSALGRAHVSTCAALEWLGCTQRSLGDLDGSRRSLQEAVVGYTRQGAGETEDCMKALSHLATTLAQLELVHEACALRRRILDVRTRTWGPDDPRTLASLENLATTLLWLRELDEADVIGRSLLEKRVRLLGEDHADTQRARELLAAIDGADGSAS
jgi:eukaryotic-like serine/threonine-protein kinase